MCSRLLLSLALAFAVAGPGQADPDSDKAKAALALAKAQRERQQHAAIVAKEKPKAIVVEGCFEDLNTARLVAKKVKQPLVLWVGMTCTDAGDVCKAIRDDVVSCHVKSYHGSDTPRVVVTDPDGVEYRILKSEFDATTPIGIRKRMGLPIKAVVIEECADGKCQLPVRVPR